MHDFTAGVWQILFTAGIKKKESLQLCLATNQTTKIVHASPLSLAHCEQ